MIKLQSILSYPYQYRGGTQQEPFLVNFGMQKLHFHFLGNNVMLLFLAVLGLLWSWQAGAALQLRSAGSRRTGSELPQVDSVVAAPGLSSCGARAQLLCSMWGPGPQVDSVVAAPGLSSCSARAQLLCSMWGPPGSRIEPVPPALQADSLPLSCQGSLHIEVMVHGPRSSYSYTSAVW